MFEFAEFYLTNLSEKFLIEEIKEDSAIISYYGDFSELMYKVVSDEGVAQELFTMLKEHYGDKIVILNISSYRGCAPIIINFQKEISLDGKWSCDARNVSFFHSNTKPSSISIRALADKIKQKSIFNATNLKYRQISDNIIYFYTEKAKKNLILKNKWEYVSFYVIKDSNQYGLIVDSHYHDSILLPPPRNKFKPMFPEYTDYIQNFVDRVLQ